MRFRFIFSFFLFIFLNSFGQNYIGISNNFQTVCPANTFTVEDIIISELSIALDTLEPTGVGQRFRIAGPVHLLAISWPRCSRLDDALRSVGAARSVVIFDEIEERLSRIRKIGVLPTGGALVGRATELGVQQCGERDRRGAGGHRRPARRRGHRDQRDPARDR